MCRAALWKCAFSQVRLCTCSCHSSCVKAKRVTWKYLKFSLRRKTSRCSTGTNVWVSVTFNLNIYSSSNVMNSIPTNKGSDGTQQWWYSLWEIPRMDVCNCKNTYPRRTSSKLILGSKNISAVPHDWFSQRGWSHTTAEADLNYLWQHFRYVCISHYTEVKQNIKSILWGIPVVQFKHLNLLENDAVQVKTYRM